MKDWVWEHKHILSGTGKIVNNGSIFSPDFIENLHFIVDGKLASDIEISGLVKRIIEQELETFKSQKPFQPAFIFEIVLRALWRIKIRELKSAKMNERFLVQNNYLYEICERIHEGEKVNQLHAVMFNNRQNVDIKLKFRNRNIFGEIAFANPLKERLVNRFTRNLDDIASLFWKKKAKFRREKKISFFADIFIPRKYRYSYSYYQLPSGYYLDIDGTFDGRGAQIPSSPINVTKK